MAAHDGIATLRRSLRVVRGERATWSVAVEARRIMATPKVPRPSSAEPLYAPWHFLYFFPLPQGQGSLRPTLSSLC